MAESAKEKEYLAQRNAANAEIERLSVSNADMQAKVRELQRSLGDAAKDTEGAVNKARAEIFAAHEAEIARHQAVIADADALIKEQQARIAELQQAIPVIEEKHRTAAQALLAQRDKIIAGLQGQVSTLTEQVQNATIVIDALGGTELGAKVVRHRQKQLLTKQIADAQKALGELGNVEDMSEVMAKMPTPKRAK